MARPKRAGTRSTSRDGHTARIRSRSTVVMWIPGYNIDTWFGDINVDSSGNVAMAVNRSSPNELIGRLQDLPAGDGPRGHHASGRGDADEHNAGAG